MNSKTLRSYQDEHFPVIYDALCNRRQVLLSYCVGAGKTIEAMTVSSAVLQNSKYTHVILLSPSTAIEGQFRSFAETTRLIKSSAMDVRVAPIDVDRGRVALKRYLLGDNEKKEIFITHYSNFEWDVLSKTILSKINNILIVIDEAHHASVDPRNNISQRTNEFRVAGGVIFKLTGTPYRTDRSEVAYDNDLRIRRSLLQHMLEGFAPSKIFSEIVTVDGGGDVEDSDDDAQGSFGIPLNEEIGFRKIVEQIVKDGRPKCIIRLKPGSAEKNPKRVETLTTMLRGEGLSVVDATGDGTAEFDELCRLENSDRTLRYDEVPDVVIAFGRMNEGVNLPSRSHVYFWGVPRSMQLFEQVLGRIMRHRLSGNGVPIVGYPEEWRYASKVTLFLGAVENATEKHTNFLLQLISYLSAFQAIDMFAHVTRINDMLPNKKTRTVTALSDVIESMKTDASGKIYTCLKQALSIYEQYRTPWTENVTRSALAKMAKEIADYQGIKVFEEEINRAFLLSSGANDPKIQAAVGAALLRIDVAENYPEELSKALDSIYEEFKNECLVSENVYLINGENASWIAERLKDELSTGPRPTTVDEVMAGVHAFRKDNKGRFPKLADRDPLRNRSFASYDILLKRGEFGASTSLYELIINTFSVGKPWHIRLRVVVDELTRSTEFRSAEEAMRASAVPIMLKKFANEMPEMYYYPKAWEALKNYDWAPELTLGEANYVGGKNKSYIQQIISQNGLNILFEKIRTKDL